MRQVELDLLPVNDHQGFGHFGGQFVAETLVEPLKQVERAFKSYLADEDLRLVFARELKQYVGRPTPLTFAGALTRHLGGARIYLKREDLNHTGAHKINNVVGQILLAKSLGKKQIIAETGAGQHGVATATVCARHGLPCRVYMGAKDVERQSTNVARMKMLGAEVVSVKQGSATLKDAINEALRDWVSHPEQSYYLIGSALGPHPYPTMVRTFQSVRGTEARQQILEQEGELPSAAVACVGGGSNAIGLFSGFISDEEVKLIGVEAGGRGESLGQHAARFRGGRLGVFQGCKTLLLQDSEGQVVETDSIAAGLDYAAIGPEHAFLESIGRAQFTSASDKEAIEALGLLCRLEGILPALESSHALAEVLKLAPQMSSRQSLIVNLSGRGDKDLPQLLREGHYA